MKQAIIEALEASEAVLTNVKDSQISHRYRFSLNIGDKRFGSLTHQTYHVSGLHEAQFKQGLPPSHTQGCN